MLNEKKEKRENKGGIGNGGGCAEQTDIRLTMGIPGKSNCGQRDRPEMYRMYDRNIERKYLHDYAFFSVIVLQTLVDVKSTLYAFVFFALNYNSLFF